MRYQQHITHDRDKQTVILLSKNNAKSQHAEKTSFFLRSLHKLYKFFNADNAIQKRS